MDLLRIVLKILVIKIKKNIKIEPFPIQTLFFLHASSGEKKARNKVKVQFMLFHVK